MFGKVSYTVKFSRNRGVHLVALISLLASFFTYLDIPAPANAAVVSSNMVMNLDGADSSSLPATGNWSSISPATGTFSGEITGATRAGGTYGGLTFDGQQDFVNFGTNTGVTPGSMTFETWIKPGNLVANNWSIIASRWFDSQTTENPPNHDWHFGIYHNGTSATLQLDTSTQTTALRGNTVFPLTSANKWYHVGFVIDSATGKAQLFVNGVADSAQATMSHSASINPQFWLGDGRPVSSPNVLSFIGQISKARLYSTNLSSTQITQNFLNDSGAYGYAPVNTVIPKISGTAKVGVTISSNAGTWGLGDSSNTTTTYKWQVSTDGSTSWTDISGATSSTFTPASAQQAKYIRSAVTKTNSSGTAVAYSTATRVDYASTSVITSGGTIAGLNSSIPNSSTVYNVTLVASNMNAKIAFGSTTGLTLIEGYSSVAGYLATSLTTGGPIIAVRGTGTNLNAALATLTYTSTDYQTDSIMMNYTIGSANANDVTNYIPIYDNGELSWHYYSYQSGVSASYWANQQTALQGTNTVGGLTSRSTWYLATPRYQVENTRLVALAAGTGGAWQGHYSPNGSNNWYWPAGTDGYSADTQFSTGATAYNGSFVSWVPGEPNGGPSGVRRGQVYINSSFLGWDDVPDSTTRQNYLAETYVAGYPNDTTQVTAYVKIVPSAQAPVDVAAATTGSTSIAVSWTAPVVYASTGITGYTIQYSTTSNFASYSTFVSSSTNTSAVITGLATNTLYYVRVFATGSGWTGQTSTETVSAGTYSSAATITVVASGGGTAGSDYVVANGSVYPNSTATKINAADIQNLLLTSGVKLDAESVVVNAPVTWTTSRTLTLGSATSSTVSINAAITGSGVSAGVAIAPATYNLSVKSGGAIVLTGSSPTLSIGGTPYTLIKSQADLGTVASTGPYALAKPLTLATGYTASPINVAFAGTLDGLGNTIDRMNLGTTNLAGDYGLISSIAGGEVRNLGLTNVTMKLASSSSGSMGALAGKSTGAGGKITQVWSSGVISTTTTMSSVSIGGILGRVPSGAMTIKKSWSSVNIDASSTGSGNFEIGGIVGGDEATVSGANASSGAVTLDQVYATGTINWSTTATHHAVGGLFGLHFGTAGGPVITDSFSWVKFKPSSGNRGGLVGYSSGSGASITGSYQTTLTACYSTFSGTMSSPTCPATLVVAGSTVSGISGANWTTSGASLLVNIPAPETTKSLYVQVTKSGNDGTAAGLGYQIVDEFGTVQDAAALTALNLSVSGTATYTIDSTTAVSATAYNVDYVSGLTLGGSAAANYRLLPWFTSTPVTISKLAQTISWTPTTSVSFGTGVITPSSLATSTGGSSITYAVTSSGSTGCTVNSSTGVITATAGGSCTVSATTPSTGDYLQVSTSATFTITEPATAPTVTATAAGSGALNIGWTTPTVSASTAISGYTLTYSTNSAMTSATSVNIGNTTGYLLSGLTPGTAYYFQVRAVGTTTWSGPLSTVVSATPNATATTITVVASGGGVAGTNFTINGGVISTTGSASINASDINTLLANNTGVHLASDTVTVSDGLSWSTNSVLTLGNSSSSTVNVNSTIAGSGATAGVKIVPTSYGLSVKAGAYIRLTGATPSFNLGGTPYTVVNTVAGLSNVLAGSNWALTAPISLSTNYPSAVKDFTFTGTMDGLGNTVNGMQITPTTSKDYGFYASLGGATVRNVGFTNINFYTNTASINVRMGAVAGNGSSSGTNTVTQVWATGFNIQDASTGAVEIGGLFGGATAGTLNISKSWSSVSISTKAPSVGSGGIIGANANGFGQTAIPTTAYNTLKISESYSVGNILRDLPTGAPNYWYGNGGIIGVSYGYSTKIENSFTWGTINATGTSSNPIVSTGGVVGVPYNSNTTLTTVYTTSSTCVSTDTTGCTINAVAGAAVAGFSTGLWSTVNGASLVNLTPPTKLLYVRVKAPTDGSFGTVSSEIIDSTGTVQTLSTLNLSISGTPIYDTISASSPVGKYDANYASGLTLGGSSASVYSLSAWKTATSVTITKLAQSISYTSTAPTTAKVNTTYTPTATSTSGDAVTFTIDASSSSVCSITGGVVKFSALGNCVINANQIGATNWLAAPQVQQTAIVTALGDQTITFTSTAPTNAVVAGTAYTVAGTVTGGGTVTFAVDPGSSAVCEIATNRVTFLAAGDCKVLANSAATTNWEASAENSQTFTVGKGTPTLAFTSSATSTKVGTTYTPVASSASTGAVSFTIDATSSAICSITGGVVSFSAVGTCKVNAAQATDVNWVAVTQVQQQIITTKGDQSISRSNTASNAKVNTTYTPVGTAPGGSVIFSIDSSSSSICSISSGVVSFNSAGTCRVNANQAGSANWNAAPQVQEEIIVAQGEQTISFSSTALLPKVDGLTYTVTSTTTSGLAATYTIDSTTAAICSVSGAVVTFTAAGDCVINANQAGNANWNAAPVKSQTITVAKGDQTISFTTTKPSNAVVGGATYSPAAAGGASGNAVTFSIAPSSSAICSISGGEVSFTKAGPCVVLADQGSSANYLAAGQVSQSFTVGKGIQASFGLSADKTTLSYHPSVAQKSLLSHSGGSGNGAVTYSVNSSSTGVCSVSNGEVTAITAGTCLIDVTKASDDDYVARSNSITIRIDKIDQDPITVSPASASLDFRETNKQTTTLTTSGGNENGAVTYSVNSASTSVCSVAGSTVTGLTAGTCIIDAVKAASTNYLAKSGSTTITINKIAQAALNASAVHSSLTYHPTNSPTTDLSATGGSGGGAVTYLVQAGSSSVCSVDGTTVTAITAGTCVIVATRAESANYIAQTATVTINVAKAAQRDLNPAASRTLTYSTVTDATLSIAGGDGDGEVTYTSGSASICTVSGSTVTALNAGTCVVNVAKASSANYLAKTDSISIEVAKAAQAELFVTASRSTMSSSGTKKTSTLSFTGGSGNGSHSWSITSGQGTVCSLSGTTVTALGDGECVVSLAKDGTSNFLSASRSVTINVAALVHAAGHLTPDYPRLDFNNRTLPTTSIAFSGGSGTGAVSFTSLTTDKCWVSLGTPVGGGVRATVVILHAGECKVSGTKAGDSDYGPGEPVIQTINVAKSAQSALDISIDSPMTYSATSAATRRLSTLATGNGTGAVTFSVVEGPCEVSGNKLTATGAGDCKVRATKAMDQDYLETSVEKTFTIAKAAQAALSLRVTAGSMSSVAWNGKKTTSLTYSGGTDGAYSVSTSAACSAVIDSDNSQIAVTGVAAGDCRVTVTRAATSNYLEQQASYTIPVLSLAAAPTDITLANTGVVTTAGAGVKVSWTPAVSLGATTSFEVQTSADSSWTNVESYLVGASQTSMTFYSEPWKKRFVRVAPVSNFDGVSRSNWITYADASGFSVSGNVAKLSMLTASAGGGDVITVTGTNFSGVSAVVEVTTATGGTKQVPATVVSDSTLRFSAPAANLPTGKNTLRAAVTVVVNSIRTSELSFTYVPAKKAVTIKKSSVSVAVKKVVKAPVKKKKKKKR